ncbi:ABC transporter ATP-binding protein [Kineosporiaceae bacterium SCSIO 59966]|nr:ABC transporter ATP-binding protein [Kineosporiaceae bacterium SCSIO 59966]
MRDLKVRGLCKAFGSTEVLHGLDLDVPSGQLAAVLGPSGCGKTTLLRVVAGFERADAGEVHLGGRLLAGPGVHVPPERRGIGVVPQEGALFPHLTVAENVAFGLPRRGTGSARRRRERVRDLLALVGLGDLGDRMPSQLSGGQQQRVALARALAPDPALVLLDEPFSALDAGLRAAVREDVRTALRATGATGLLVTHDQEEALSTADLVAVVRDGVVVQSASPQQLYAAPGDLDVATFVGEAVVLPARVRDGVAETPLGRLALLRGDVAEGPGRVVIRPEQVRMVHSGGGTTARVVGTVFYGHDASVRLQVPGPDGAPLPVLCRTQGPLPTTEEIGVVVAGPVSFFADA